MKRDVEVLGQLGRYQLIRRLGRGANAEVFLAEFEGPGGFRKQVALKRYFDQQQRPGFTQEAKLGGVLRHFNLVELLDIFEDQEGSPLLVLEYINGPSVAQLLDRYHALPPLVVFELAQQLLRGLEHGHRQLGLVHRDLKPENLLIDYESAQLKIADFGIAVSEHNDPEGEQWIVGTPPYMSPEQIRLDPLDGRSDLFAVGSILYELFTGSILFRGEDTYQIFQKLKRADEHLLEADMHRIEAISPALPELLKRVLKRDRSERFPDAQTMRRELRKIQRSLCDDDDLEFELAEFLIADRSRHDLEHSQNLKPPAPAAASSVTHSPERRAPIQRALSSQEDLIDFDEAERTSVADPPAHVTVPSFYHDHPKREPPPLAPRGSQPAPQLLQRSPPPAPPPLIKATPAQEVFPSPALQEELSHASLEALEAAGPFEEAPLSLYKNQERCLQALKVKLRSARLVTLYAPSESGKSALLRALLSTEEDAGRRWEVIDLTEYHGRALRDLLSERLGVEARDRGDESLPQNTLQRSFTGQRLLIDGLTMKGERDAATYAKLPELLQWLQGELPASAVILCAIDAPIPELKATQINLEPLSLEEVSEILFQRLPREEEVTFLSELRGKPRALYIAEQIEEVTRRRIVHAFARKTLDPRRLLEALFTYSMRSLSESLQVVLPQLWLLERGAPIQRLEQFILMVSGGEESAAPLEDALHLLSERGLVERSFLRIGSAENHQVRQIPLFSLPSPLRPIARRRLGESAQGALERRYRRAFARLGSPRSRLLFHNGGVPLRELLRGRRDLSKGLQSAIQDRDPCAFPLAMALIDHDQRQGLLDGVDDTLQQIDQLGEILSSAQKGSLLLHQLELALLLGDEGRLRECIKRTLSHRGGSQRLRVRASLLLARSASAHGQLAETLQWLQRATNVMEGMESVLLRAELAAELTEVFTNLGRYEEAEICAEEAIKCATGDRYLTGEALHVEGRLLIALGQYKRAGERLALAQREFLCSTALIQLPQLLLSQSEAALFRGQFKQAVTFVREARRLFSRQRRRWGRAQANTLLGQIKLAQDDPAGARLTLSRVIGRSMNPDPRVNALAYSLSGIAAAQLGEPDWRDYFQQGERYAQVDLLTTLKLKLHRLEALKRTGHHQELERSRGALLIHEHPHLDGEARGLLRGL